MSASRTGHQVNGLYPIIRRVRRPLLPVDPPAETKPVAILPPEVSKPTAAGAARCPDEEKADASETTK
jgi:hypothetical protein